MKILFFLALIFTTIITKAQEKLLLVGTYTKNISEGIYVYSFSEGNGEIKKISVTKSENPSYLAVSENNKVYSVNENNGEGKVGAYSFDKKSGTLQFINSQSSNGAGPCYIAIDKTNKWVVTANYTGGNFCVYPVNNDGSLGPIVQNIHHSGSSIDKSRQEKPHVHSVVFTPDQKYIAVVDLGIDKIIFYPFDASRSKPVVEKGIEVNSKPGVGPRHIIFHPTHPFAYVIEELSGYVSAYRIKNGKFTYLQTINAHPADFKGDIGSAAIKLSPDGKFLYASNRGTSNTIAVFAIEQSMGQLKLIGIHKTGGDHPRDIAVDPSGKYLLSANSRSNTVSVFKLDPATGLPEDNGKQYEVPEPTCLVFPE